MKRDNRVSACIDIDAIKHNLTQVYRHITKGAQVMVVVKANAYGHGTEGVANNIEDLPFVWGFGVATLEEGVALRNAGVEKSIIVLGCVFPDQYHDMVLYDIIPTVYTIDMAKQMNEMARTINKTLRIHIKVDSGMGRIGFLPGPQAVNEVAEIFTLSHIKVDGMFTHFAKADEKDESFTLKQKQVYDDFLSDLFTTLHERYHLNQVEIPFLHCNNSAGILAFPQFSGSLVRCGLASYGLYPSDEPSMHSLVLKPALQLISHVTFVKEVPAHTPISYGATYITPKPMKIATIPVGYGDGYPRSLSNQADVLIRGQRCRVLGRICMDQFMVDVTHLEKCEFLDEVVLIGTMGEEEISLEELSAISNRFNYEFLCCLGVRIPRHYYRSRIQERP